MLLIYLLNVRRNLTFKPFLSKLSREYIVSENHFLNCCFRYKYFNRIRRLGKILFHMLISTTVEVIVWKDVDYWQSYTRSS